MNLFVEMSLSSLIYFQDDIRYNAVVELTLYASVETL